jgi:phage anti-repressor protein
MDLKKMEQFLMDNSKINKKFIKDFFGIQMQNKYKKQDPFIIDFDSIVYWLDVRKDNLKKTLCANYMVNIDFIIEKTLLLPRQKRSKGGQNKELILLTSDCFKMLCMRSKTKKAEQVRKYYIELEKMIDKYKEVIIKNQLKEINILKQDLRKEEYPIGGHCYIFKEVDELEKIYYRIGRSDNMKKRMANHNSSTIHKKVLVFKIKTNNISHYEACLRSTLFNFRYKQNKDYYRTDVKVLKKAIKNCNCVIKTFKKSMKGGSNIKFDMNKINDKIKVLFSKLCECVMWNLYNLPKEAYYYGKKITNKKLNEIIIPESNINKVLIVPIHRSEEYMENINLGKNKLSYHQLFNILFKFYNKVTLEMDQLKSIPSDIDNYVRDAIVKYKKGKPVHKIELIGNLCRFEGIKQIEQNIYFLVLGS